MPYELFSFGIFMQIMFLTNKSLFGLKKIRKIQITAQGDFRKLRNALHCLKTDCYRRGKSTKWLII